VLVPTRATEGLSRVVSQPRNRLLWFGRIAVMLAVILLVVNTHAANPNYAVVQGVKNCVDGTGSDTEAQNVGLALGQRYYDLLFDASIFSEFCTARILSHTFRTYDEATSLKLVTFFWSDAFLGRLREVSLARSAQLSCDLICLLGLVRAPLPSLSLYQQLSRDLNGINSTKKPFLLARSLFVQDELQLDKITELLQSISGTDVRNGVVKYLYLLGNSEFIRKKFGKRRNKAQICLGETCVDVTSDLDIPDCEKFNAEVLSRRNLDDALALKVWVLNEGREMISRCVSEALDGPIERVEQTSAGYIFQQFIFDSSLQFNDLVNNYKSSMFKEFSFLENDISALSYLDLRKLTSVSFSFSKRIIDQLATDLSALTNTSSPFPRNTVELLSHNPSAARLELILCQAGLSRVVPSCNRRALYLSAIDQSFQ